MTHNHSDNTTAFPKTCVNVRDLYRKEYVASGKYGIYAKKLSEEGYESLANFFFACSHSDIIHATRLSRVAMFLGVRLETEVIQCEADDIMSILADLLHEECNAMEDYSRKLRDAEEEKCLSAILSMSSAMKADRTHYDYCKDAIDSVDFWRQEKRQFYVCALCGYIHQRRRVICPLCGAKPDMFLAFPDDGHFDTSMLVYTETDQQKQFSLPFACHIWNYENIFPTQMVKAVEFTRDISRALKNNAWASSDIYGIILAITEAATNANEHGNKGIKDKKITVECSITEDFFFCSIQDEGKGFTPQDVPNPCLEENMTAAHGRGLKLISNFMTKIWFNSKGNKIYMIKNR